MPDARSIALASCLAETIELLVKSSNDGWPDESPAECQQVLNQVLGFIRGQSSSLPEYWEIQYAPTGPVQEIAMSNGWHDDYMRLSESWDTNCSWLKKKAAQQGV